MVCLCALRPPLHLLSGCRIVSVLSARRPAQPAVRMPHMHTLSRVSSPLHAPGRFAVISPVPFFSRTPAAFQRPHAEKVWRGIRMRIPGSFEQRRWPVLTAPCATRATNAGPSPHSSRSWPTCSFRLACSGLNSVKPQRNLQHRHRQGALQQARCKVHTASRVTASPEQLPEQSRLWLDDSLPQGRAASSPRPPRRHHQSLRRCLRRRCRASPASSAFEALASPGPSPSSQPLLAVPSSMANGSSPPLRVLLLAADAAPAWACTPRAACSAASCSAASVSSERGAAWSVITSPPPTSVPLPLLSPLALLRAAPASLPPPVPAVTLAVPAVPASPAASYSSRKLRGGIGRIASALPADAAAVGPPPRWISSSTASRCRRMACSRSSARSLPAGGAGGGSGAQAVRQACHGAGKRGARTCARQRASRLTGWQGGSGEGRRPVQT